VEWETENGKSTAGFIAQRYQRVLISRGTGVKESRAAIKLKVEPCNSISR